MKNVFLRPHSPLLAPRSSPHAITQSRNHAILLRSSPHAITQSRNSPLSLPPARRPQDVATGLFLRGLAETHAKTGRGFSDDGASRTTRAGLQSASGRPRRASAEKTRPGFRAAKPLKKSPPPCPPAHPRSTLLHPLFLPLPSTPRSSPHAITQCRNHAILPPPPLSPPPKLSLCIFVFMQPPQNRTKTTSPHRPHRLPPHNRLPCTCFND